MFVEELVVFNKGLYYFVLSPLGQILRNWWWLLLPFLLKDFFLERWLWWKNEAWLGENYHPILLELKIPYDSKKPIRAMETVMANIHAALYHMPDLWEKYVDGQLQTSMALELVSIEGDIHFYLRMNSGYRDAVEAAFYAQYPSLEIIEVEDYTRKVPLNIPNKDWDLWATDYVTFKKDAYPIKTYTDFETEREVTDEQKIDPVAVLMEAFSKVGPKEQIWIQFVITPVGADTGSTWISDALEVRDKLAKRPDKVAKKNKSILFEAAEILLTGEAGKTEEKKEAPILPPEMKMTPGERDVVAAIENKASKQGFNTFARFVFLGKRGFFHKGNLRLPFIYFSSYVTNNLNALYPFGKTITKVHYSWFLPLNKLRDRRKYLRQRKLFRNYINRLPPLFPHAGGDFILNTEELASLFHFPSWGVSPVPGVSRVSAKTKAPPILPR